MFDSFYRNTQFGGNFLISKAVTFGKQKDLFPFGRKVVKELEEVYKVHIGGIPQKEYYLTTTFDNTPIEDIIEIINQTLDTKLDITQ